MTTTRCTMVRMVGIVRTGAVDGVIEDVGYREGLGVGPADARTNGWMGRDGMRG